MTSLYEAVVVTNDGTYRAFPVSETLLCVTEDGVEGIIDFIDVEQAGTAPENLVPQLLAYTFERLRGLDVISATLTRRK